MSGIAVRRRETATLSPEGRVVIPASIRKSLGLLPGATLTFRVEGDEVVMTTRDAAVTKLQRMFRDAPNRSKGSLVDELIVERRADAERGIAE